MSLINSLFSGVSGLRNHQTMMDVIGNNIANVNSIGYKGSRVTFSDTFNQFVRFGSNPTADAGGTNTFQVGLGMKLNSVDRNWNQGTFERTGIVTDLALQGKGLFVLESNGERFFSRAGAFVFDADGKLVNPQNGAIVQGKVAQDGTIPPGNNLEDIVVDSNLRLPAVATTDTSWGGNLDSTSSITRSEVVEQQGNINSAIAIGAVSSNTSTIYDDNGDAFTFKVDYTKTAADTYNMSYTLTDSLGNVEASGGPTVMAFDAAGNLDPATGMGGAPPAIINVANGNGINYDFDPTAITQTTNANTISMTVDSNREPTIVTGTLTIFDSLGEGHTLSLKFTKTSSNNWNWNTNVPSASGNINPSGGTITFDPDGSISTISPNPTVVTFTPTSGAGVQNIELDFGSEFNGVTQTSSNSVVSALTQNGSSSATMSNISIDQYGFIVGVFTNGQSRQLAQVMVSTFPNLNGLISVGDNMYSVSANTGDPLISEPGETSGTTIQSGALEQSNVDLSEEFTRMIVSQRGFQANARVVTVSDTLLQEVTNLVR